MKRIGFMLISTLPPLLSVLVKDPPARTHIRFTHGFFSNSTLVSNYLCTKVKANKPQKNKNKNKKNQVPNV